MQRKAWKTDNVAVTSSGRPEFTRTCRESLQKLGYDSADIITTLEARMKCGVGKCGRCNIAGYFICLDGPGIHRTGIGDDPARLVIKRSLAIDPFRMRPRAPRKRGAVRLFISM